jgi:hypothetical protein
VNLLLIHTNTPFSCFAAAQNPEEQGVSAIARASQFFPCEFAFNHTNTPFSCFAAAQNPEEQSVSAIARTSQFFLSEFYSLCEESFSSHYSGL